MAADMIAGASTPASAPDLRMYYCTSEAVHTAFTAVGTRHWQTYTFLFHGSMAKWAQSNHFGQYETCNVFIPMNLADGLDTVLH